MKKTLLLAFAVGLGAAAYAQQVKCTPVKANLDRARELDGEERGFFQETGAAARNGGNNPTPQVQGTKFTSSYNALTTYVSQSNCLTADQNLNAVMFTHRLSPDWGGTISGANSGYIQYTFTTNNGTSWDSMYYSNNGVNLYRYPSGTIANPASNTSIANAVAASAGPYTDGAGWEGYYWNSTQMNNSNSTTSDMAWGGSGVANLSFPRIDIASYDNGTVWLTGGLYADDDGTTAAAQGFRGAALIKGTLSGNTVNFTVFDSLKPNFHQDGTGANDVYTMTHLAFSQDGQTGYAVFFGVDAAASTPTTMTFLPIVYKSTDAGTTWVRQPLVDFSTYPVIMNNTAQGTGTLKPWFSQANGSDVTVDMNGNLHIVCTIEGGFSDHPDSLSYYGVRNDNKHFIYDVYGDGATWNVWLIDSIMTNPSDANSIFFDSQNNVQVGNDGRVQVSRTQTGSHLFYYWADSDPTIANSENAFPDHFGKAVSLSGGPVWTARKQFTQASDFYFHFNSNITLSSGNTFSTPTTSSIDRNGSHDVVSIFDHYYYSDVTWQTSEFTIGVQEQVTPFGAVSLFPNPADEHANLSLELSKADAVTVSIINTLGQQVNSFTSELPAGKSLINLNTSNLQSGVYFVNIASGHSKVTHKLVVN